MFKKKKEVKFLELKENGKVKKINEARFLKILKQIANKES